MTHSSNATTANQLLTKEDLAAFHKTVINDIRELLSKSTEKPTYLKSGEVRQILKISKSTLQLLRVNGKLSCTKLGNTYYYKYDDICKLMNNL